VDAAVATLRDLGAVVTVVDLGDIADYCDCKTLISAAELFAIHKPDLQTRPEMFGAKLRRRVLGGAFVTGEDYVQAVRWRTELARKILAAFRDVDALVTAGWLATADPADPNGRDFLRANRLVTMPFSLAGIPAMSVPCGFGANSLPLSLQIAALPFDEATVLRIGDAYEHATGWHLRAPDLT
jgi:aspartyl-tRNA(Asn)/glutamyl-tRNA(Gln) amidotransferase subunit A